MAIQGPPPIKVTIKGDNKTDGAFKDVRSNLDSLMSGAGKIAGGLGLIGGAAAAAGLAIAKLKSGIGEILKLDQSFARLKFTEGFTDLEDEMVQKEVRSISRETGIAQEEIIGAIDKIGDAGFSLNQTFSIVRQNAKAAKAFGQPLAVFADQAFTLGASLKVPFERMNEALDITAQIGTTNLDIDTLNKLLADAGLAAQSLGLEGVSGLRQIGAALQIVRTGVKDSGKGMRAFSGVVRDAISDESIKKFKEGFGVDLMSEISKRTKEGDTEFAAYLKTVQKVAHSNDKLDREQRLNYLFSGEQVGAVRALIDNLDALTEAYQSTGKAVGTIERGFKLQRATDLEGLNALNQEFIGGLQSTRENLRLEMGTEGLERESDARKILRRAQAQADSLVLRKAKTDTNVFKGVKVPAPKKVKTQLFTEEDSTTQVIRPAKESKEEEPPKKPKTSVFSEDRDKVPGFPPPERKEPLARPMLLGGLNLIKDSKKPEQVVGEKPPSKVEVDVNFNNVPQGVQVRARGDKNVTVNPSLGMSFIR